MMRNIQCRSRAAAIGLVVFLHGGGDVFAFAPSVEVRDCAGAVPTEKRGTRYVLTTDIDCTDKPDPWLALASHSVLDLRGYTLSNGDVLCAGTCRIVGPGTIRGGGVIGNGQVTVRRTTITGSPSNGVLAINAKGRAGAMIVDSVISSNAMTGVEADRTARIIRSKISENGRYGVAVSVQAFNDCTRGRIRSWHSTISGNGLDVACGTSVVCADVASCARHQPSLHATQCDTSYELGSGMPGRSCGVCTRD
jgi:hypothetical protein